MAHWARIMADESNILRAILYGDEVAGNIVSWEHPGEREVGYWLGREFWGKDIATRALSLFLERVTARPLYAHVIKHNRASIRVLQKCGFTLQREADEEVVMVLRE
jgi:RimJ/RimL family protein N-acetyltransferase